MINWLPITFLSLAILAILLIRAIYVVGKEKNQGRGCLPGDGFHEIRSDYFSGGSGGGHSGSFRVPKDPQKYAQQFVPNDKRSKDEL